MEVEFVPSELVLTNVFPSTGVFVSTAQSQNFEFPTAPPMQKPVVNPNTTGAFPLSPSATHMPKIVIPLPVKGSSTVHAASATGTDTEEVLPRWGCSWGVCSDVAEGDDCAYSVDEKNPSIATKTGSYGRCTITGDRYLPLEKLAAWWVKVVNSSRGNCNGIYVGVAPSIIEKNASENHKNCGWYFHCYDSTLWSGEPQSYRGKKYGPREEEGQYMHSDDRIGVIVDTAKGNIAFTLYGMNLGVAYEGVPLDTPLVPCVILGYQGDSVEIIT